jgi:hypothetical protein
MLAIPKKMKKKKKVMKMHKQSFLCQLVSILDPLISSSKRMRKVCEVEVVSQAAHEVLEKQPL